MAYTTIQGQTPLGTTKPGNLRAAFITEMMAATGAPNGIGVTVEGMLANSNPGMYGLVLGFSTPAGMRVDVSKSGSWSSKGSHVLDMMKVVVTPDAAAKAASTEYWEVWYKQSDVDANDWSTQATMIVAGSEHSYVLTKRRTGDGLDDGLDVDGLV